MVYLIQSGNFLKIGYSSNIENRMKQYRTHNPDFKLLKVLEGDSTLEQSLHLKFKHFQYNLEWFYYDESILDEFDFYPEDSTEYFYTFDLGASSIYTLNSLSSIKVLLYLCTILRNNCNIINLSYNDKLNMKRVLGISSAQFSNNIKTLKDNSILYCTGKTLKINPCMFWKGSLKERDKLIVREMENLIKN